MRRGAQRMSGVRPEIEGSGVRYDLNVMTYETSSYSNKRQTDARTLLSQIARELRSQWKRTWKSGFSLINED